MQVDHPLVTATQIADHEAFHAKANRNDAEMIDRLAERIADMDRDAFDRVVDKYTKAQTIFSIQPGNRSIANAMLNDVTDRYLRNGYITEEDRQNFFDRLVELGTVTVPAEEIYREAREYLQGGRIYVEPSVVADFGDEWADKNMRDFHVDFQNEK